MSNMTEQIQRFVQAKLDGLGDREAAVFAGYAVATAHQQASRLMKRADVQAAIKAGKKAAGKKGAEAEATPSKSVLKGSYASAYDLLKDIYNNPKASDGLRFEAAKLALPYEKAKKGELGKKEQADQEARRVSRGDGKTKPRFARKAPPTRSRTVN